MNERERFEKFCQAAFVRRVEQIPTMTETQVVDGLRAVIAARNTAGETLAFLHSVSLVPTEDSEDEIKRLRSDVNSCPHPTVSPFLLLDHIGGALKKRLETLRKKD